MRGLRTIPVLLDVCRDMEELPRRAAAPVRQPDGDAVLGGRRASSDPDGRAVPLGPAHGRRAGRATSGSRRAEIDYHVAGINHLAFFLRLERGGEDLYPALRPTRSPLPRGNRVRNEVMSHLGSSSRCPPSTSPRKCR